MLNDYVFLAGYWVIATAAFVAVILGLKRVWKYRGDDLAGYIAIVAGLMVFGAISILAHHFGP